MVRSGKIIADLITFSRAGIGIILVLLGWLYGDTALRWVAWLMLANWIGDVMDGAVARRSTGKQQTWIGDHDLEVDMLVSIGLGLYLVLSDRLQTVYFSVYILIWASIFLYWGFHRQLGMLFQAPIYLLFLVQVLQSQPIIGIGIIAGLLLMILATWPRFPNQVIPEFLNSVAGAYQKFVKH